MNSAFVSFSKFSTLAALALLVGATSQATVGESSSNFPKLTAVADKAGLRPHVAINAGLASPEGSYRSAPEYALDVGYQPIIPISVGMSVATSRAQSKGGLDDLNRTSLLAYGAYNFGGTIPVVRYSYMGAGVGPVFEDGKTDIALAPIVGFDIPISPETGSRVSIGAQAKYLIVNNNEPDALSVNGVMKYWF